MAKYKSPKEALDAASNPETSLIELRELANYDFLPVTQAIVLHPNTDTDLLLRCFPKNMTSDQNKRLVLTFLNQESVPHTIMEKIHQELISISFDKSYFEIALSLYSRMDISLDYIQAFIDKAKPNSAFRNALWGKTSRAKVRNILDKIKNNNRSINNSSAPNPSISNPTISKLFDPQTTLDQRLIGSWTWSDASLASGYGLMASVSVHETFVFLSDGYFFRRSDVFASSSHRGYEQAFAQTPSEDRGRWSTSAGILTLDWDDNMVSEIPYYLERDALELTFSKGPRVYLKN